MSITSESGATRREFLRHATMAAATAGVAGAARRAHAANSPNARLRIGIIGCGGRSGAHVSSYDWVKSEGLPIEIAAVCDVYKPRRDRMAKKYDAKAYEDYRELLADPSVDVVSIATPDHHHGYQALDAVKAGKDVYCEKPVTHWRQFELTRELAMAVKESGRVFQLGTQGLSDSAWHQMKKMIAEGAIGKPIHAECGYFRVGDWGESGMPIDDANVKPGPELNWEAFLGDAPRRPFDVSRFFRWRMYEDYSGGPVTDLFPHSLTPTLFMLGGGMPAKVVGVGGKYRYEPREVPDTFNMLIEYPGGLTVAVLGTQGNPLQGTGERGAGGRVPIIRGWDAAITLEGNEIVLVPVENPDKNTRRFPVEQGEDTKAYFKSFIEHCLNRDTNTASNAELAYQVQTALQMGALALREDKVARFDAAQQRIVL